MNPLHIDDFQYLKPIFRLPIIGDNALDEHRVNPSFRFVYTRR